jgi:hypothetical protein
MHARTNERRTGQRIPQGRRMRQRHPITFIAEQRMGERRSGFDQRKRVAGAHQLPAPNYDPPPPDSWWRR